MKRSLTEGRASGRAVIPLMLTLTPHINRYLRARVQRSEISESTAASLRYSLRSLAEAHGRRPLTQMGPRIIDRWLESIRGRAPATRRQRLSAARGFFRWMVAEGLVAADPTVHVPPIRQPRRVPVTLTSVEVARLLAAAPDERARAILWLMVGCGCRCIEISRLRLEDYTPGPDATVRLIGKAGHERVIPVPAGAVAAIDRYLDVERGRRSGPLIENRVSGGGLSNRTLGIMVRGWMRAAGVKTRALDGRSAHGLRRTAASDVMERSGDLRAVQEMLGHVSIETTAAHYLRPVSMRQLRSAMEGRDYEAEGGGAAA